MNGDFLWVGWICATRPKVFVCQSVQGLSLIAPERTVRFGRDKHQKMRQSAGTTMAFVTWRHVSRVTRHVLPRKKYAKKV